MRYINLFYLLTSTVAVLYFYCDRSGLWPFWSVQGDHQGCARDLSGRDRDETRDA